MGDIPGSMGSTQGEDRERGALKQMFTPWDLTNKPGDNSDRVKKLGKGDASHMIAISGFNDDSFALQLADGIGALTGTPIVTRRPVEPDNWMLRFYDKNGEGIDGVWSLRLIAEHEHANDKRSHRSTMVMDQCDDQNYAWLSDLFWIKKLDLAVSDKEIQLDKAGLLAQVSKKKGKKERATLMLNIAKNAGATTDGNDCGNLWHVLHLSSLQPAGGVGQTQAGPSTGPGSTQASGGDCGKVEKKFQTLRGDVFFDLRGEIAPMAYADPPEDFLGLKLPGRFYTSILLPEAEIRPPLKELGTDPNSNQKEHKRENDKFIYPFCFMVRPDVPTPGGRVPVPNGYDLPAGEGAPVATPSKGQSNDTPVLEFKPGKTTGTFTSAIIPFDFINENGSIRVQFTVDTLPALGEILIWHLGVAPKACGETTICTPVYTTITFRDRVLPGGDPVIPAIGDRACFDVVVPREDLENGDDIQITIFRSQNDTFGGRGQLIDDKFTVGNLK